jgi:hypothetical protein
LFQSCVQTIACTPGETGFYGLRFQKQSFPAAVIKYRLLSSKAILREC